MSGRQWTVLALMLGLFGLEFTLNPPTRAILGRLWSYGWKPGAGSKLHPGDRTFFVFWAIAAAVLLTLTDAAPRVTFWLMALLIVGVALRYSGAITTWLNNVWTSGSEPGGGGGGR